VSTLILVGRRKFLQSLLLTVLQTKTLTRIFFGFGQGRLELLTPVLIKSQCELQVAGIAVTTRYLGQVGT